MEYLVVVIGFLLMISLALSAYRKGKFALHARVFRFIVWVIAAGFFTYWFVKKSVPSVIPDSMSLKIVNYLPQPLDFYVVKVKEDLSDREPMELLHSGKIRTEHFRVEYLKMEESSEYWVVGFLGKDNLAYFSQHSVPNKNMDQVLEINNYINQSLKLSTKAKGLVQSQRQDDMSTGGWVTFSLLLLFLNGVTIFQRKKKTH